MGNRSSKSGEEGIPIDTDKVVEEVGSNHSDSDDGTSFRPLQKKTKEFVTLSPKELFQRYDVDRNGEIDVEEFQKIFTDFDIDISPSKAKAFFAKCDKNHRGSLNYDQFYLALFAVNPLNPQRSVQFCPGKYLSPHDLFAIFDADKSNAIDREEFSSVLQFLNFDVALDKLEYQFSRCENPETQALDYQGFRELWLSICNPIVELQNRNVKFHPRTPRPLLVKKLRQVILDEEKRESQTFNEAEWWSKWETVRKERTQLIQSARDYARLRLADAIDAAGQVYAFGAGPSGCLDGQPAERDHLEFENFSTVLSLWTERVKPRELTDDSAVVTSINNPEFSSLHVCVNTAWLWGRAVHHVACGGSVVYALTGLGDIYCWGGNENRWKHIDNISDKAVTPRSTLIKMSTKEQLDEDARNRSIDLYRHTFAHSSKPENALMDKSEMIAAIIALTTYYRDEESARAYSDQQDKVLKILEPKLQLDRIRISLQLRGIPYNRRRRDELIFELGQALLLEIRCMGMDFHTSMQRMDEKTQKLLAQHQTVEANKLLRAGKQRWKSLETTRTSIKGEQTKLYEEARREWNVMKDRKLDYQKKVMGLALEFGRVATSKDPIQMSGLTARGPNYKFPLGTKAVMSVAVGMRHAVAIHQTGRLYSWGVATFGRLGTTTQQKDTARPMLLETVKQHRFKAVSCGFSHSAAVTTKGDLFMWGSGATGKLGLRAAMNYECYAAAPVRVEFPQGVRIRRVACGAGHTVAITTLGQVYVWGCGDGGRLGLGDERVPGRNLVPIKGNLGTVIKPKLVESLMKERIVDVSCGVSHTALTTAVINDDKGCHGGVLYVAGSAHALGRFTPEFTTLDKLKNRVIASVSCGASHTAAITVDGELYTWGSNATGCTGHKTKYRTIRAPRGVKCCYRQAQNISKNKDTWQSTISGKQSSELAVNGNTSGNGAHLCIETLREECPAWQVDLGAVNRIERIVIYNRTDRCIRGFESPTAYRDRSFPMYIILLKEDVELSGGISSLRQAKTAGQCRKFVSTPTEIVTWDLPPGSYGRHVRIQLASDGILNLAQVKVFGRAITECIGPRIHRVCAGDSVTVAISRPLSDYKEIERRYIEAVCADADNSLILRQYDTFQEAFKKFGDCREFRRNCPTCATMGRCPLCKLIEAFPKHLLTPEIRDKRSLEDLSERLLEIEQQQEFKESEDPYESDHEEETLAQAKPPKSILARARSMKAATRKAFSARVRSTSSRKVSKPRKRIFTRFRPRTLLKASIQRSVRKNIFARKRKSKIAAEIDSNPLTLENV